MNTSVNSQSPGEHNSIPPSYQVLQKIIQSEIRQVLLQQGALQHLGMTAGADHQTSPRPQSSHSDVGGGPVQAGEKLSAPSPLSEALQKLRDLLARDHLELGRENAAIERMLETLLHFPWDEQTWHETKRQLEQKIRGLDQRIRLNRGGNPDLEGFERLRQDRRNGPVMIRKLEGNLERFAQELDSEDQPNSATPLSPGGK